MACITCAVQHPPGIMRAGCHAVSGFHDTYLRPYGLQAVLVSHCAHLPPAGAMFLLARFMRIWHITSCCWLFKPISVKSKQLTDTVLTSQGTFSC